ncbi:outer membrane protein assembly factor BamB family protein [Roseiconus lacunae]|uniref:PQQ-like beta-propeller repeat protein n=1 Tax=Roseiconus lacunae TaxID=2605694 RepID=A0ABT7PIF4_9BACT|nr:PQQ-binding-like beta-propeller repeat protein [Roseiconus lacunae]MDM4016282.1 PQQ-like beta-propeller repeat protein [Roseiconus lacunae]WRQ52115.1 PQQ-binding-like beta-propeller repeat protein [Stieleria sp. HD01]
MMKSIRFFCLVAMLCVSTIAEAQDANWPQWRGVNRDGHAAKQNLLQSWPTDGPSLAWSAKGLGTGYSACAVVGDLVYTMGSKDGQAVVDCLSLTDGTTRWSQAIGPAGQDDDYNTGWGAGQRSTPTVDGNQVFAWTDKGVVAALNRNNGDVQWSVDLVAKYGGKVPTWGYSASPLVDGNRVIVCPGGDNFLIGLNRRNGNQVWGSKGVSASAEYVSPIKATVGNKTFYVTASKPGLYGFDVKTGEKLFEDSATGNNIAVIPTPIVSGDLLYHTSAYGAGNVLLRLVPSADGLTSVSVYALNSKSMENHHGGVVLVDGVIYGFTKQSGGCWMAQDLASGESLWTERARPNRSGSICYADGRLYCYGDKDGSVELVEPSRDGFKSHGKLVIPQETSVPRKQGAIWAHPVVAGGKLIIRDQDLLYAFDVSAK